MVKLDLGIRIFGSDRPLIFGFQLFLHIGKFGFDVGRDRVDGGLVVADGYFNCSFFLFLVVVFRVSDARPPWLIS